MAERIIFYPNERNLQTRAQKLERAKGIVETTSQNLGGDLGPKKLDILNPQLLPSDPFERVSEIMRRGMQVAEVRQYVALHKLPNLDAQLADTNAEIKKIEDLKIAESVARLSALRAFLKPEEIEILEAQIRQILPGASLEAKGEEQQTVPPTVQPPVEGGVQPEEENLPEVLLDEGNFTLSLNGHLIKLGNAELIIVKPLLEAGGKPLSPKALNDLLEEADYSRNVSTFRININEKAGIELIRQAGSRKEGFQYVLPRKLSEEEQKPEKPKAPKKEFGKEPVADVNLNLLNSIIENPQITFEEARELRGLMANGRPFNKWALIHSLQSAVNVLMTRTRQDTLTEAERATVDTFHSIFKGEEIKDSLKVLRDNIYKWLMEDTPIIPVSKPEPKDEEKVKRYQESRQILVITLDGKQIKVMGRLTAVSLQTLANTSSENKIRLTDLAMALYGKDDQESLSNTRSLMGVNNKRNFVKLDLEVVIEGIKDQSTVYLKRLGEQLPQPPVQREITQLEESLANLTASRPRLEEAVNLGLPGNYEADLERLDQLIEQKNAQLEQIRNGN